MKTLLREAMGRLVSPDTLLPEASPRGWPRDVPPPSVHLAPAAEDEVALVLERAGQEGWSVLPSGSGSWLRGGGTPGVDILLSTRRLGEMSAYEPADLTFTAGAGLPLQELAEATGKYSQWVPLDPAGWEAGTLGGMVATGRAGPLRMGYGCPRDHVLGLTLVAGDGRILRWGGRVVKNVAGFDVTRLCVGSLGALGVITAVSCRVYPLPEEDRTLLLRGPGMEGLLPVARQVVSSSASLAAVEMVDPLEGVLPGVGGGAGLVIRLMGSKGHVAGMARRVTGALGTAVTQRSTWLGGEETRKLFHHFAGWEEGAGLVLRLSLLPSRAGELLEFGGSLVDQLNLGGDARMALHVGWGVLRVAFAGSKSGKGEVGRAAGVLEEFRGTLEEEGGGLVLSEGPAGLMEAVGPWGSPGPEKAMVRGLKQEFDPQGILAPGRIGGIER